MIPSPIATELHLGEVGQLRFARLGADKSDLPVYEVRLAVCDLASIVVEAVARAGERHVLLGSNAMNLFTIVLDGANAKGEIGEWLTSTDWLQKEIAMPPIVPNRFLVRMCHSCPFVKDAPRDSDEGEHLLELPESARLDNFAALDEGKNYADVRVAWNDFGLAVQVEVSGKSQEPVGDADRPSSSDVLRLWIDTRDARASHRGSRYCHQFAFYPTGGGSDNDQPFLLQSKINRALQDAPLASLGDVLFRAHTIKSGYRLEVFLPAAVLNGYDPHEHPRLGIYYCIRDQELGDQFLSVGWDFPFAEDPSLWSVLELVK